MPKTNTRQTLPYEDFILRLLKERGELTYNPIYIGGDTVTLEIVEFFQSLKDEGWAVVEVGASLSRMLIVVDAALAEQ
jgi:hypothetical protein